VITVKNLGVTLGEFVLEGVSFEVPRGAYGALMGKTGSGKTTILECVCGLRPVCSGQILLDGEDVTHLKPGERGIGYVPQDAALFVTMTVRGHLSLALRIRRWKPGDIDRRVGELAEMLGIAPLLDRHPHGLSGGEAQRVSLGRALSHHPSILCLDEPLSALDDETHGEMCELLTSVRERTGVTTLHVTHRRQEVERLADRLLVIEDGKVRELTTTTGATNDHPPAS